MIRSFRSKPLKAYASGGDAKKLAVSGAAIERLTRQLARLDAAVAPEDMDLPGWYFHSLRGERRFSVRVTANYRLTFGWEDGDAVALDLEDYH